MWSSANTARHALPGCDRAIDRSVPKVWQVSHRTVNVRGGEQHDFGGSITQPRPAEGRLTCLSLSPLPRASDRAPPRQSPLGESRRPTTKFPEDVVRTASVRSLGWLFGSDPSCGRFPVGSKPTAWWLPQPTSKPTSTLYPLVMLGVFRLSRWSPVEHRWPAPTYPAGGHVPIQRSFDATNPGDTTTAIMRSTGASVMPDMATTAP
jgi:hypothetical protein